MFELDKDKYPFPVIGMDKEWLNKKIKLLGKEVDYSVYAEPITIVESLFKNRVQNDADVRLRFMDEIKYLNKKIYAGSHSRLSDDEPYVEFIVHIPRYNESNYGLWAESNSKNLKPILKYKGNRKVKARLRKKKSICVGYIDKDGCYHIGQVSPSFKGIYNFFNRCFSYNKKLRKVRKFKRR